MNCISYLRKANTLFKALLFVAPAVLWAEPRNFALPDYKVNPGSILEVPLTLDNAAGLAAIQVQVNYNPEVLELLAVAPGALGAAFELHRGDGAGFVRLSFFRADALAKGSGRLAALRFRANPGAVTDLFSELAIAELTLSDSTGVTDLRQKDAVTLTNGEVAVSAQPNIDNAHNGLPDWWEVQHGLDLFAANANHDAENDGLPNLLEYAFGGNPKVADAKVRGLHLERTEQSGESFLSIGFYRRIGDSSLALRVQESADLGMWSNLPLPQQIIGTPQNMGDGTEHVNVRGTMPITGPNAQPKVFMRVEVQKQ
jgi:hypothetical protein